MNLPPGPPAPMLVQTAQWLLDPTGSIHRQSRKYGDTYTVRNVVFGTEAIFTKPDDIRTILTADEEYLVAGEANTLLRTVVGDSSVLLLDGKPHTRRRKLLMPPFHGERMQAFAETMRDAAAREGERHAAGDAFSFHQAMQRVTLDVILRLVLGLRDGPDMESFSAQIVRFLDRAQSPTSALFMLPAMQWSFRGLSPFDRIKKELDQTDEVLYRHIASHRARPAADRRGDVLDMLLDAKDEEGSGLTDKELRDELTTLLLAGHETSATTLAWAFEEILRSEGEQERLREEVLRVTGGAPLTSEHVAKLERLDSAVKETLRLHPVTIAVARKVKKPFEIGGYLLPPGVLAIACMYLTHRRPDLYPDPERFIGDRFVGKKMDPYEWLPFGGGTRRCLGMAFALYEMKVVLATLLSRYRFSLARPGRIRTTLRGFFYAPKGKTMVRAQPI